MKLSLEFDCVEATTRSNGNNGVTVVADEVKIGDIYQEVITICAEEDIHDLIEIINNNNSILDAIGIEAVKDYFDLEEKDA